MILFYLIASALAEPQFEKLKAGEQASFDGRLLNDEAIATMISQCEFDVSECEIKNDLECSIKIADKQYELDVLQAKYDSLEYRHTNLMEIKEEELKVLRAQSKPQRAMWAFFGGFAIGTGASVATVYALNKTME